MIFFRGKKNPSEEGKSRKKKKSNKTEEYEYVSDDDRLYGDAPDPESREYFYDEIDEFHAKRDKVYGLRIICSSNVHALLGI